jgi:putative membrane protein
VNPASWYLWIKALHIVAVMSWMAGLLYLPRLFVYHCETVPGTPESERFKVMERRLLRAIMTPAMIVAWLLGVLLAVTVGAWDDGWFHAKLLLVILLSAMHGMLARWQKDFAKDDNKRSQRFYRIANEIPALFMLAIVILVVVKPF